MFEPFTTIFGVRWSTFTLLLLIAGLISAAWLLIVTGREQRGKVADTLLGGLLGAILVGRGAFVMLHRAYFSQNLDQIPRLNGQGGLDWHGALLGFLLVGWLVSRLRGADFRRMLAQSAPLIPFIALASWTGCAAAHCAYGAPVNTMADYPAWMTWIAPDIYGLEEPRFAVQMLAMAAAGGLLLVTVALRVWRGAAIWQLWLILILWSAISFVLGFLRGDAMPFWNGLRADQWLALLIALIALLAFITQMIRRRQPATA